MIFRLLSGILLIVGLQGPTYSFTASPIDSIDQKIERGLTDAYNTVYFLNYDSTADIIDEQINLAKTFNRWHLVLYSITLKAKCAYNHYHIDKIRQLIEEAEAVSSEHTAALDSLDPGRVQQSEIDYVRGMYFHELGDFSRAVKSFESIIAIHEKYNSIHSLNLYYTYSFIGDSYFQMMLYDKAYINYEQGSVWLSKVDDFNTDYQRAMVSLLKAKCKEHKALHHGERHQVPEALQLCRHAMRLLASGIEKIQYEGALTSAHLRMSSLYRIIGYYDSAVYFLNASFRFQPEKDPRRVETYVDFGDLYKSRGLYEQALPWYEKSIAMAEASYKGKHFKKSIPLFRKAEILLQQHDFVKALATCHNGLTQVAAEFVNLDDIYTNPPLQSEANINHLIDGLWLKGKILYHLYLNDKKPLQLEASLKTFRLTIDLIEEAQKKYTESEYKQTLAAKATPLYEDALEAAFAAYSISSENKSYADLIFNLLEASKSTLLRDAAVNTQPLMYAGIPKNILEFESFLKGSINALRARLYENPGDTLVADWKTDLYKMSLQYDSLVEHIKKDYPQYYQLKYGGSQLAFSDVSEKLGKQDLLIEYFWGDRAVYVTGLSRDRIVIKKIKKEEALTHAVTNIVKSINTEPQTGTTDIGIFKETSHYLYLNVLAPILDEWPSGTFRSLIVVADGPLSYLPFDILISSPAAQEADYSALPYLLKNYSIRNSFAASFIASSSAAGNQSRYTYMGFAPHYTNETGWLSSERSVGGSLVHNIQEVKEVSSYFSGAKVFLHDKATEQAFRNFARYASILHLSMHAFADDTDPSFSGLLFTASDSSKDNAIENDGMIRLYELYNLPLNADLAVLSACETGTGRYTRGEGIMSMGRAFRYAGCENIIMSLWNVNDRSSMEIMKKLFHNLHEGMDKDESLRKAKISFLEDRANKYFTHPYYWSAFILAGDPAPLESTHLSLTLLWIISGLILITTLVFLFRRAKSNHRGSHS